ncbi:MAG: hypothetical protein ACI9CF_001355 [Candidatus Omnitrophota bacterium]|jgi:hypothetical protein
MPKVTKVATRKVAPKLKLTAKLVKPQKSKKGSVVKAKVKSKIRSKKTGPSDIQLLIREKAYFNYLERGASCGFDESDWLKAESEVMQQFGC